MAEQRRLPVWDTVIAAGRLLAVSWKTFFAILTPLLAVLASLDFALARFWSSHPQYAGSTLPARSVVMAWDLDMALLLILGALTIALWQRWRVIGPHAISFGPLSADWRDTANATLRWGALIVVFLCARFVAGIPIGRWVYRWAIDSVLVLADSTTSLLVYRTLLHLVLYSAPMLVALHVAGRLGVALWALPPHGDGTLRQAWDAGRGNGWHVALALYVVVMPLVLLQSAILLNVVHVDSRFLVLLLTDVFGLLQTVVSVAVIAAAQERLSAAAVSDR